MNATTAPDIPSRTAQARAEAAPVPRLIRAESALSFADMLAERAGPEASDPPRTPDQASREAADEPREAEAAPVSDSPEPSENPAPDDAVSALPDGADISQPVPADPDHAGAAEPSAAGDWESGVAGIHGITRELTHAAAVDLAELARDELVSAEPAKPPPKIPGKHPGGPSAPLTAAPAHPNLSGSGEGGVPPRPGTDSDASVADAGRPSVRAAPESEPVRSATPDAGMASQADPGRAEAVRAQAGVRPDDAARPAVGGSVELLTRLTGSVEAARGAIEGVGGAGGSAGARDAHAARAGRVPAGAAGRGAREQVLASVQRGLASVLTQGGGRMTVVLRPERLGEVRVRMEARGGVVSARMSASTEAARRTLEAGLDSLRAALESRGVRVESLEIDTGDGQARADADGRGGDRRNHQHESDRGGAERGRADGAARETAPASRQGIWTEIGIDAVA